MAGNRAGSLLRGRGGSRPISYVELFFDLAFIFALTQLTDGLLRDLSARGGLHTLLLLAAVWWVWTVTAWSTDWFEPEHPAVRLILAWVMFGGLLLAAAIPRAFSSAAPMFACAYVAVHLGRGLFLRYVLREHPSALRSARVAIWFAGTGVLWLVGGFVPAVRLPLWAVAIVVDATIGLVGYPVPRLGRSTQEQLRPSGTHLSERYSQFFIVAIGELILVSGIAFRRAGFGPAHVVAFALAFVDALLLTQIYHHRIGIGLASSLDRSRQPGREALVAAYLHFFVLASVLITAAGNELVIEHPVGQVRLASAVTVIVGTGLFIAWRILLLVTIYHRVQWWTVLGLAVVVGLTPAMTALPPVAAPALIDFVLLVMAVTDRIVISRTHPPAGRTGASP